MLYLCIEEVRTDLYGNLWHKVLSTMRLDAIRPSQYVSMKQTLSKDKVNGRPIHGASQEDRPRYALFVATTNNSMKGCMRLM